MNTLDAVGVHGVGGIFGAMATGLLATTAVNAAGANGAFFGNPGLLTTQAVSILMAVSYAFVVTWMILKILEKTIRNPKFAILQAPAPPRNRGSYRLHHANSFHYTPCSTLHAPFPMLPTFPD